MFSGINFIEIYSFLRGHYEKMNKRIDENKKEVSEEIKKLHERILKLENNASPKKSGYCLVCDLGNLTYASPELKYTQLRCSRCGRVWEAK